MDLDSLLDETEALINSGKRATNSKSKQHAKQEPATTYSHSTSSRSTAPARSAPLATGNKLSQSGSKSSTGSAIADDLDDLLSEFADVNPGISSQRGKTQAATPSHSTTTLSKHKDGPASPSAVNKRPSSQGVRQHTKCSSVVLTAANLPQGIATAGDPKSCLRMRCTSCDHSVTAFDNFVWDPTADYLFFRNNYPEFQKLRAKLTPSPGSRAYACQCSSASVLHGDPTQRLDRKRNLKWVCGRHTSS